MNLKSSFLLLIILFQASALQAQTPSNRYQFLIDLNKTQDDKLFIELNTPQIDTEEVIYYLPKIVPGTYSIYDFGRFVSDFKAEDKEGNTLAFEKVDENGWKISNATQLSKITYWVEDTYDTDQDNIVFEPSGTNIEEGKNFVFNTHGFLGYFEGMKRVPYLLEFTHPENFYGSTALIPSKATDTEDVFEVENYIDLVDSPIMYNEPDTTILQVGGADILVSVYSPNKQVQSNFVAENIRDVLEAQKTYLGGSLPIRKYAFIIYLSDTPSLSELMGALEHSYSSLYYFPEISQERLASTIRDIAAHEFFHILTPLSIHSEEIHNFDFNDPKMSKHLWLYEGVVEYFAGHVQVQHGLMDIDEYLLQLRSKIESAKEYKQGLSFTEMSSKCLGEYKDEYGNVYEKGALIGLCLDIRLRQLSNGQYGLRNLMADLSNKYGKDKAFKDEELFDEIAKVSKLPAIRSFFTDYVEGTKPLPLSSTFKAVGISFQRDKEVESLSIFDLEAIDVNDQGLIYFKQDGKEDKENNSLKYKMDDVIDAINGKKLTLETASEVFGALRSGAKAGQKFEITVLRGKKNKPKKLKGTIQFSKKIEHSIFEAIENPSPDQVALLRSWLAPEG